MISGVSKVESHIACSPETGSEMVLPIIGNMGTVLAVFDLDSTEIVFDATDKEFLSGLVDRIRPLYDQFPALSRGRSVGKDRTSQFEGKTLLLRHPGASKGLIRR